MSAIDRPAARPSPAATAHRLSDLRGVLLLVFAALALLGLLQVSQIGDATSTGYNIRRLERERQDWDAQVRQLEAEVASPPPKARTVTPSMITVSRSSLP